MNHLFKTITAVSRKDTIGRVEFILSELLFAVIAIISMIFIRSVYLFSGALVLILYVWLSLLFAIRRLRDLQKSPYYVILLFFPVIGFVLIVYLCVTKRK